METSVPCCPQLLLEQRLYPTNSHWRVIRRLLSHLPNIKVSYSMARCVPHLTVACVPNSCHFWMSMTTPSRVLTNRNSSFCNHWRLVRNSCVMPFTSVEDVPTSFVADPAPRTPVASLNLIAKSAAPFALVSPVLQGGLKSCYPLSCLVPLRGEVNSL